MPLPFFKVERFHIDLPTGSMDMLKVTCPRDKGSGSLACGKSHWVEPGPWRLCRKIEGQDGVIGHTHGRSCPYCFRASSVPVELRILEGQQELDTGDKPRKRDTRTPHMKKADREGGLRSGAVKGGVVKRKSRVVRRKKSSGR